MKNHFFKAILGMAFLASWPAQAQTPVDAFIPGVVTVGPVPVLLPAFDQTPARTIFVTEANVNNRRYLFPAFELLDATVSYQTPSNQETPPSSFLRADGAANVLSSFTDSVSEGSVTLRLRDLLFSDRRSDLLTAYASIPGQPSDIALARTRPEWNAQLEIRDSLAGRYLPIGTAFPFERSNAQPEPTVQFALPVAEISRVLLLLRRPDARENLRLRIQSRYDAKGVTNAREISVDFLSRGVTSLVQQLTSKSGALQPSLLIPLGGGVDSRSQFEQLLSQGVNVVWLQNNNFEAGAAPPEVVAAAKAFLTNAFANVQTSVQWAAQDQNKVVSFLLSNGIRMTAPVNKVTQMRNYFKTDTERKTKELFENDWRRTRSIDVETAGSVDLLGIFGASGSLATHYDGLDETHKKELREAFQRDLNEVDRFVSGELTTVAAMDVQQVQNAITSQSFRANFTVGTFDYVVRDLQMDSGLRSIATSPPLVSPLFRQNLESVITQATNGFPDGYNPPTLPGVGNAGLLNVADSPRRVEYLIASAPNRAGIQAVYRQLTPRLDGVAPEQWIRFENAGKTEYLIFSQSNGPSLLAKLEENRDIGRYYLWLYVTQTATP